MTLVAVACAAVAAALLVRPPARLRSGRAGGAPPSRVGLLALASGPVVVALVVAPRLGLLVLVAGGALVAAGALWRRRLARRSAAAVSAQVLETCELLAAELSAGQPPGQCLDRAATAWPPLGPVAEAFRVGADVPTALRELADDLAGARDLRVVAAAWQVAHRTGAGLAAAVDRVAESLRAAGATRRVVAGELASARATARLVAGLPVLALAMGSGAGGNPWGFLLGTPPGLACLAGGLAFGFAGLWWIEAIARSAEESA
ncbi:type II secretion system F family protein [Nocardioides sp. CN2-186]